MSTEDKWGWLMLGAPGVLLTVATPQLPQPVKVVAWLLYVGACIAWIIYRNASIRRWRSRPWAKKPMTIFAVVALGALIGALAGGVAWTFFPAEAAAANPEEMDSGDLKLDFRMGAFSYGQDHVVMQPIIATNQSSRRMSLSFNLAVRTTNKDGHDVWNRFAGYWNGTTDRPESGKSVLNLDSEASEEGKLVFRLVNPAIVGIPKWEISGRSKDSVLEIHERVTGKKVGCRIGVGYPPAIDCPPQVVVSTLDIVGERSEEAKNKHPFRGDPLDLKFRSSLAAIFPFNQLSYKHILLLQEVTFVNHSERNMSLRFLLLARINKRDGERSGATADGIWREGPLVLGATEGAEVLNIPRDSAVTGTLIFKLHDLSMFKDFYEIEDWEKVGVDKMTVRVEDLVTGKIAFLGMSHYPPGVPFADVK